MGRRNNVRPPLYRSGHMTDRNASAGEDWGRVIRGSLIERSTRCGNPNCRCRKGRPHGPYFYLSVTLGVGRTKTYYVPQGKVGQVREGIASYQRALRLLQQRAEENRRALGIGGS